jgi:AcrR family transcriptional regulator
LSTRKRLSADARREIIEAAATEVFAERGYHGASIDEIARRSGVSAPVVYDHFASKQDLHRRLLERHTDDLLDLWREHLPGDAPAAERIPRAIAAWAAYVETHPFAWQMLFRDSSGDPEVQAAIAAVRARGRAALVQILGAERGAQGLAGAQDAAAFEMAVELIRSGLTGLAVWWREHPQVPREHVVATAMNVLWIGFERVSAGDRWQP